ncbi:Calcium-dependent protein kinase SK5 [Morella rubra]|uniref:non-specific serine/threonine protein kinase n=1 Tax=Morella rubra TaxID=262757 RepID=A0A6A1WWZ3_9ROSI|nr:Calcium-dependent protein kinase SK5 [Morella rubra]
MNKSSSAATPKDSNPTWVLPYRTQKLQDLYTLGPKLGQGRFGITYLCTDNSTGQTYACKSIPKRKLFYTEDYDEVLREIQIMKHLSEKPNVVKILDSYEDAVAVHLVMELCEGGELFDRIVRKGHYSEREAAMLMKTIMEIVHVCHSLGVMHRDLKPENFLFDSDRENAALKATDFGLSVFYKPGVISLLIYTKKRERKDKSSLKLLDVRTMLHRRIGQRDLSRDIARKTGPSIRTMAWHFRKRQESHREMLERDPKKRLTAHDVLCHPWITADIAPDKPLDSAVLSRLRQFSAMNKLKKMAVRTIRCHYVLRKLVLSQVNKDSKKIMLRSLSAQKPSSSRYYGGGITIRKLNSSFQLLLQVIAERLSEEEIGDLKEWFKAMDTDNSGTITFDELKDSLKQLSSELMESDIKGLMDAADFDNSETLDYCEFLAATVHLKKLEEEEILLSAFSFFDKDGSGYITVDELQEACKEFGLSEVHLDEVIKEIDEDKDGQIDYREFAAMMKKGNGGMGRRTMRSQINLEDVLGLANTGSTVH